MSNEDMLRVTIVHLKEDLEAAKESITKWVKAFETLQKSQPKIASWKFQVNVQPDPNSLITATFDSLELAKDYIKMVEEKYKDQPVLISLYRTPICQAEEITYEELSV